MKYLQGTQGMVLRLSAAASLYMKWFADSSFAVHPDMKSHTGYTMTMGRGSITSNSSKQKLNTTSSTEAELVSGDSTLKPLMWSKLHVQSLGYKPRITMAQDNASTMKLMQNGKASSTKRTRHLNIRCFAIKDHLDRLEFELEHCSTDDIWSDFMTKPLQGKKFTEHRDRIMGAR